MVLVGTCRHQAVNWSRYVIVTTFQYRYWLNLQCYCYCNKIKSKMAVRIGKRQVTNETWDV